MGSFSVDWLTLREPADARARSSAVVEAVRGSGFSRDSREQSRLKSLPQRPLSVVDLGAGTGANFRYLAPKLGGVQRWQLVDSDPELLARSRVTLSQWAEARGATVQARKREIAIAAVDFACTAETVELDLAQNLKALALPRGCLVTASALLDLVSARWLETLADECLAADATVLFALTYDGRMTLEPAEPDDELARTCFNRHQLGDKGFGHALGPGAARAVRAVFERRGYALTAAESDWRLDGAARELQAQLIDGWLRAALEIEPESARRLELWHARHRERIDSGGCKLVVGHTDLAGFPREPTR